jgi:hypothetical protein
MLELTEAFCLQSILPMITQGTVTAQGENNGINGFDEVATNAFDNTNDKKWLDFANNYPNTRQSWIQYQYPNGQRHRVTRYDYLRQ